MMSAPCRGIAVGTAQSLAPATVDFTRVALAYDFLRPGRERVRMTMFYRDITDVRLEEKLGGGAGGGGCVLSFRVAGVLDRFAGSYDPANPAHRLSIGFGSTEDAARCREEVVPLMRRAGALGTAAAGHSR